MSVRMVTVSWDKKMVASDLETGQTLVTLLLLLLLFFLLTSSFQLDFFRLMVDVSMQC